MSADISKLVFPHTRPVGPARQPVQPKPADGAPRFDELLRQQVSGLRFSAHAQERMRLRGMELSQDDREQLEQAVDRAAAKGARDSLVLLRDMAFVVSVKNRTVITAMDEGSMKENVFTNIDSAVIL